MKLKKGRIICLALAIGSWTLTAETLENERLRISFASQTEGFGVIAIENKLAGGARFVRFDGKPVHRWRVEQYLSCENQFAVAQEPLAGAADLWELELRAKDALGDRRQGLFIDNRSACRARRFERMADGVAIRFDGVRLPDGEADVVEPNGDRPPLRTE